MHTPSLSALKMSREDYVAKSGCLLVIIRNYHLPGTIASSKQSILICRHHSCTIALANMYTDHGKLRANQPTSPALRPPTGA